MAEPAAAPRRLILLRHGQTAWNLVDRAQGHADIELDETGWMQAKSVAPALAEFAPSVLWSSDLARARQTAECVAESCGLPVVVEPRFREYAVGVNRTGLTMAEYAVQHPQEHAHLLAGRSDQIPGRETDDELLARFLPALSDFAETVGPGECGVLISHGAALRTALAAFLGWPLEVARSLGALTNCGWAELDLSASGWDGAAPAWRLRGYNRTA